MPTTSAIRHRLSLPAMLVSIVLTNATRLDAAPVINEFMASNGSTLLDEDGDSPDWIEIFNPDESAVELEGWHLTDNSSNLQKWTFPAVTLAPNNYLIVFASDKDRRDPASGLHANFKLSASGEYLALVAPDGITVASAFAPDYPQQVADVSYGSFIPGASVVNVLESSNAEVLIPRDDSLALTWTGSGFTPDASWISGEGQGVGYGQANYQPFITTDVKSEMRSTNASAYIRMPFVLDDASRFQTLRLRIRWEDGFVAYLNGVEVTRRNAPPSPTWDSTSLDGTNRNPETEVVIFEDIDFDALVSELLDGQNVLAIHGLNNEAGSSDFLIDCQLMSTRSGDGTPTLAYHTVPSPGGPGGPGEPALAALISDAFFSPTAPGAADPITVTATVHPALTALGPVTLHYRTMFEDELELPMHDDGAHGDGAADDGVFAATIPSAAADAGEMLRWYITANDVEGATSRWPVYAPGANTAEYFGTVIPDPSISSQLSLFQYFIEDTDWYQETGSAHFNKDYTSASLSYLGRFYDNVRVKIRGSSSVLRRFPKQSMHFDFPSNMPFYRGDEIEPEDEININQLWTDKAYVRNTLSMMSVYKPAGVTAPEVFPLLTYRNGQFFSVAIFIEEPGTQYLKRNGLDPDGAYYKMQSPMTSAAVYPDYFPGFNPDGSSGAKKRTRLDEDQSDLQEIVTGTASGNPNRNAFLYDHFDVPQIINYMAASVLIQDWDRYPKNHFMYRDTEGTGLWQMHPWDADLSWGYAAWWTDSINASHSTMSHPLYGESSYPGVYGQTHRLVDAFHDQALLREMFLRRLRTLMDQIVQPPGTPSGDLVLETEIERLYDLMHTEVDADKTKWGMPFGSNQTLRQGIDAMLDNYLTPRRTNLYNTNLYGGIIPGSQPLAPTLNFSTVVANPPGGDQAKEYAVIDNPNSYAVDLTGWRIDGGIRFEFAPGTVITANASAYLTQSVPGFLGRTTSPKGGEGLLVLGEYSGQLSARGESLTLLRDDETVAATVSYPGDPSSAQDFLRLSEIHFAPAEPTAAELATLPTLEGADFEFLELANTGTAALDLTGVRFIEGIDYAFPSGTTLPAGDRLIIARNPAAFALRHSPGGEPVFGPWLGKLSNDGETIAVVDASGETILRFTYNDSWYRAAEDFGHSLVMRDLATTTFDQWGERENWALSAQAEGSPWAGDSHFAINFDAWIDEHFTAAELGDTTLTDLLADPDRDGFVNLVEYAHDTDPRSGSSRPTLRVETVGDDFIEVTFKRLQNAIDIDITPQITGDLRTWNAAPGSQVSETTNDDGSATVVITLPVAPGKQLARVKVSIRVP